MGIVSLWHDHINNQIESKSAFIAEILSSTYLITVAISSTDYFVACQYFNTSLQIYHPQKVWCAEKLQIVFYVIINLTTAAYIGSLWKFALVFNDYELFREFLLNKEIFPRELQIQSNISFFNTLLFYLVIAVFLVCAMIWVRRYLNEQKKDQEHTKLNIRMISIHILSNALTLTSLLIWLTRLATFLTPGQSCLRYLSLHASLPRVLSVFEVMEFLAQLIIYYICFRYTNASSTLVVSGRAVQSEQFLEEDISDDDS